MKIYAAVFIYKRPIVLRHCLESIFANTVQPDEITLIDNASGLEVASVIMEAVQRRKNPSAFVDLIQKPENKGASHSGRMALARARVLNPDYFFPLESDYIFKPWAFESVIDVFQNTEQGKLALGISGYDHPNFYNDFVKTKVFPDCMRAQVGEDNVNRAILHRQFYAGRHTLQFVSNTCPTSYLNWKLIQQVAAEFPELNRYLDEVMDPHENPNYPDSGIYRQKNYIDDGMLSHCISLCWNRWAKKHNIDRSRFAAWLNIKPSIANNITGGGDHATVPEMATDGGSPSWTD